jgi:hypothetical protein
VPKLLTNFGEILSRAHGNFELKMGSWILSSSLLITIILHIIIMYFIGIVKIIAGRERRK